MSLTESEMEDATDCIRSALAAVLDWSSSQRFRGWDPYDGSLSRWAGKGRGGRRAFFLQQFNLYSPVNLRKAQGIPPLPSNQGNAVFAEAFLEAYRVNGCPVHLKTAEDRISEVRRQAIQHGPETLGVASNPFPYGAFSHELLPSLPDAVGTCHALIAVAEAFAETGNDTYRDLGESLANFLCDELLTRRKDDTYFRYTPTDHHKVVFNISAMCLGALARAEGHGIRARSDAPLAAVVDTLLAFQHPTGYWPYSLYLRTNRQYRQLDFHQGYILEGLWWVLQRKRVASLPRICEALKRGLAFYLDRQFRGGIRSDYRFPIRFPTDIHNQAQGIVVCSLLAGSGLDPGDLLGRGCEIASYTVKRMQDPRGFFYVHRWPGFANRIPYMRWAQPWMALALARFLSKALDRHPPPKTNLAD